MKRRFGAAIVAAVLALCLLPIAAQAAASLKIAGQTVTLPAQQGDSIPGTNWTLENEGSNLYRLTVTGTIGSATDWGIEATDIDLLITTAAGSNLTINGGVSVTGGMLTVSNASTLTVNGRAAAYNNNGSGGGYGIYVSGHFSKTNTGTLIANGGSGTGTGYNPNNSHVVVSYGLYAGSASVANGALTAAGGAMTGDSTVTLHSCGIYTPGAFSASGGKATATGGVITAVATSSSDIGSEGCSCGVWAGSVDLSGDAEVGTMGGDVSSSGDIPFGCFSFGVRSEGGVRVTGNARLRSDGSSVQSARSGSGSDGLNANRLDIADSAEVTAGVGTTVSARHSPTAASVSCRDTTVSGSGKLTASAGSVSGGRGIYSSLAVSDSARVSAEALGENGAGVYIGGGYLTVTGGTLTASAPGAGGMGVGDEYYGFGSITLSGGDTTLIGGDRAMANVGSHGLGGYGFGTSPDWYMWKESTATSEPTGDYTMSSVTVQFTNDATAKYLRVLPKAYPPAPVAAPQTGDHATPWLWAGLLAAAGLVAGALSAKAKRKA